jgi:hypothetical protein
MADPFQPESPHDHGDVATATDADPDQTGKRNK